MISFMGCASFQAALDYEPTVVETASTTTTVETGGTSALQTTLDQDSYGKLLSSVALAGAEDVVVVGDVAYVASGSAGLYLVDVYDSSNPFVLTKLDVSSAWKLNVENDQLFVSARGDGLYVVDVSMTSEPQVTDHYDPAWDIYDGVSKGEEIVVVGGSADDGRMEILSKSGGVKMEAMASVTGASQIGRSVLLRDDYAYVGHTGGELVVWDLLDPIKPQAVASFVPEKSLETQQPMANMRLMEDLLFAAVGAQGIRIFDVSIPSRTELLASYEGQPVVDFVPFNARLVVAGGNGISLVDVSEPKKPTGLDSQINLTLVNGSEPRAVVMNNGIAYVADHGESALSLVSIQGEQ